MLWLQNTVQVIIGHHCSAEFPAEDPLGFLYGLIDQLNAVEALVLPQHRIHPSQQLLLTRESLLANAVSQTSEPLFNRVELRRVGGEE